MPKLIPPTTIKEIFPPNENYQYFEKNTEHPFKYKSEQFQMVNAWWLADAALLSYAEKNFVEDEFQKAGLNSNLFSGKSTQCYVAHNDNFVIVAFRGTQVDKFQDIVKDIYINLKFIPVDSQQGGFVHQGFKEGLNEIWSNLFNHLDRLQTKKPERTFWFTGHSLGAALATLAADRFGNVQGLYTFGSPLVGDDAFTNDFQVDTYRFVNNNDFITLIPARIYLREIPLLGSFLSKIFRSYQHVGKLKYIDSDGDIIDNPNLLNKLVDSGKGQVKHFFNSISSFTKGRINQIPVDFTDHAPIYYAIHIWNNYEKSSTLSE